VASDLVVNWSVIVLERAVMHPTNYQAYVHVLCTCSLLKPHERLLASFPGLDMDQRSAVAKLCRAQSFPPKSTRLAKMTNCLPSAFRRDILPLCQTPILAGLVLQLILSAPMSQLEVDKIYLQSMIKEMMVMESVKRPCSLHFEPFFGAYDEAIHSLVPCNPAVARFLHKCINDWIESPQNRTLFPRVGSKTVSKMTAHELYRINQDYKQENEVGITPIDLERVYHQCGILVSGPCEMRQKWYSSNLQPRTYYAQGGDAYHTSKYLAIPLVELCDSLPATNRRTRVDPSRIVINRSTDDVVYYDLTSFTSNMHVQCEFMYRLAQYCRGVLVNILDSVDGIIPVDLGELIYAYTRTNLHDPSYTIPTKYGDPSVLHYHSVAGFLGVYGNIASATFLHGMVMAMLHHHLDENNVAGDDGLDVTSDVNTTLAIVGTMGTVMDEKTFRDSEGCCIHLKRPIHRIESRLLQGELVAWPSLESCQIDVDIRYPYLKRLNDQEKRDTIASSVTAFLRKLELKTLDDDNLEIVDVFLSSIYRTYGLPREGCVPQATQCNSGFVSAYEKRYIGECPLRNTINRNYTGIAKLPLRGKIKWEYDMFNDATFLCNQNKLLKHLVVLGYLHHEKISSYVYGKEGLDMLLKEYTHPEQPIYEFTILRSLPVWLSDFMFSNS
jgi:hypothetical protein